MTSTVASSSSTELASSTRQWSVHDRTLIEPDTKPTFENSDNGSNDKDLEGGKQLPETEKVGHYDNSPLKVEKKQLILIGLGLLLVICFLGGVFGTMGRRKNRSEKISAMTEEFSTRPTSPLSEIITLYTNSPTMSPTISPTLRISPPPTMTPTALPTTSRPTATPTMIPQPIPSPMISPTPSGSPTDLPTAKPTAMPVMRPQQTASPTGPCEWP